MNMTKYNIAATLQHQVCEYLNAAPMFVDLSITVIPENAKDIESQIRNNIARQGLACILMTPDLRYIGHNGTNIWWDCKDVILQIAEYVPMNRASNRTSCVTGLDIAEYATEWIAGPNADIGFGNFCPKQITQGEAEGVVVTKAMFDCNIACNSEGILSPYVKWEDL